MENKPEIFGNIYVQIKNFHNILAKRPIPVLGQNRSLCEKKLGKTQLRHKSSLMENNTGVSGTVFFPSWRSWEIFPQYFGQKTN